MCPECMFSLLMHIILSSSAGVAGLLLNTMGLLPMLLAEFDNPSDLALGIALGIARVCEQPRA